MLSVLAKVAATLGAASVFSIAAIHVAHPTQAEPPADFKLFFITTEFEMDVDMNSIVPIMSPTGLQVYARTKQRFIAGEEAGTDVVYKLRVECSERRLVIFNTQVFQAGKKAVVDNEENILPVTRDSFTGKFYEVACVNSLKGTHSPKFTV